MTTTAEKTAQLALFESVRKAFNDNIKDPLNLVKDNLNAAPQTPEIRALIGAGWNPAIGALNAAIPPLHAAIDATNAIIPVDPATPAPTIAEFIATPAHIQPGLSCVLSATVIGATNLTLDGKALLPVPKAGIPYTLNITVTPTAPMPQQTYRLIATGPGGSATLDCFVTIKPPVVVPPAAAFLNIGGIDDTGMMTGTGTALASFTYFLDNDASSTKTATVGANGKFAVQLPILIPGPHTVDANLVPSGVAVTRFSFTVPPLVVPPVTPPDTAFLVISKVDETGMMTGTGTPGGRFVYFLDDDPAPNKVKAASVGPDGNFAVQLMVAPGRHKVDAHRLPSNLAIDGYPFTRTTAAQVLPPAVPDSSGFAASFPNDEAMRGDPRIIFLPRTDTFANFDADFNAGTFEAPQSWIDGVGTWKYNVGSYGPSSRAYQLILAGKPALEECYFRYYFLPMPGYPCNVEGKKMPGMCGQMGSLGNGDGNGGSATTGRKGPDGLLSGWSARGKALPTLDPADKSVPLATYCYEAEMNSIYGTDIVWNCAPLVEGQAACIEQYIKMNTIDMSVVDQYGNGRGRRDGIIRQWVDDVLVLDVLVCFRHNPAIGISDFWMTHYHGGMQVAEKEHWFKQWGVVAATKRIGMMRAAAVVVPDPVGTHAVTIISRNTPKSVNPCPTEDTGGPPCKWSGSDGAKSMFACWSGAILNQDTGEIMMLSGGEGYNGPAWAFDPVTGLWRIMTDPTTSSLFADYTKDATYNRQKGTFADGVVAPGHTYDSLEWLPAAWGGGPKGSLLCAQREVIYGVASTAWSMRGDVATRKWYDACTGPVQQTQFAGGGASWVRDVNNRRFIGVCGGTSRNGIDNFAVLTFPDQSGIGVQSKAWLTPQGILLPEYPVQRQAPAARKVLIAGGGPGGLLLQAYDSDKLDTIHTLTWSGDAVPFAPGIGLAYVPDTNEFWAMPTRSPSYSGDPNAEYGKPVDALYRIIPPTYWFAGTWRVARFQITGAVGYTPTGMWKRLEYHQPSKSLIWCCAYDGPTYSLKVA